MGRKSREKRERRLRAQEGIKPAPPAESTPIEDYLAAYGWKPRGQINGHRAGKPVLVKCWTRSGLGAPYVSEEQALRLTQEAVKREREKNEKVKRDKESKDKNRLPGGYRAAKPKQKPEPVKH